jgi:uncharacterized protein YecE (DUF72 family)
MAQFWVGVSGFSYASWKGTFYPEATKPNEMLEAYAMKLNSVEVNSTFYHMPVAATTAKWAKSTPDSFRFSFKTTRKITHFMKLKNTNEEFQFFLKGLKSIDTKLGCVLVQLPPYMKQDYGLLEKFLAEKSKPCNIAVELRHNSWFGPKLNTLLSKYNAALCVADTEDMKPKLENTANFGYARLRREQYSKTALSSWAGRLRKFADELEDCFIYFMHDESGEAANRAAEFSSTLNG